MRLVKFPKKTFLLLRALNVLLMLNCASASRTSVM
jgi:hypothetical protein